MEGVYLLRREYIPKKQTNICIQFIPSVFLSWGESTQALREFNKEHDATNMQNKNQSPTLPSTNYISTYNQ